MSKENLNLYQKLHKIQSEVLGLGKDGKSYGYQYVTGTKVIEHIKPIMNELGLLLKQEILDFDNVRQDYSTKNGEKSEILTRVKMKFTWIDINSGETDENLFGANGQNDWEKGLGSALTYAERYFLLKYFHISTDEDDIDNPNREQKPAVQKPATSNNSSNANANDDDKPWLNKMDKQKNFTKQWLNVVAAINKGTIKDITAVREHYKVSKATEEELNQVFNRTPA